MAVTKKSDTAWNQPATPPPPLFTGEKERNLVKQVNDELIERVIGQQIAYFAIDVDRSDFHPLYGEAILKTFLPPVRVYALVKWEGQTQSFTQNIGIDKGTSIEIHFHKKRLTEDQDLFVREGDFVLYGDRYYEIVQLSEPRQLFGQIENKFEIKAKAIRAREGIFNPQFTANTVPTTRRVTSSSTGSASTYNPTIDAIYTNVTVTNNTTTNTLTVNSTTTFNGAVVYETVLVSGQYTVVSTDYYVGVNTTSATGSILLPAASTTPAGRTITIVDQTGNASTNNIHISGSGADTIDGDSVFSIESDYGSITVFCTSTGWHII
jgi:hypothetical protein